MPWRKLGGGKEGHSASLLKGACSESPTQEVLVGLQLIDHWQGAGKLSACLMKTEKPPNDSAKL